MSLLRRGDSPHQEQDYGNYPCESPPQKRRDHSSGRHDRRHSPERSLDRGHVERNGSRTRKLESPRRGGQPNRRSRSRNGRRKSSMERQHHSYGTKEDMYDNQIRRDVRDRRPSSPRYRDKYSIRPRYDRDERSHRDNRYYRDERYRRDDRHYRDERYPRDERYHRDERMGASTRSSPDRRRLGGRSRSLERKQREHDRKREEIGVRRRPSVTRSSSTSSSSSDDSEDGKDLTEDQLMAKLMGITQFNTTKGKEHSSADASGINKRTKRRYRQYMNRRGGFNRPLSPVF